MLTREIEHLFSLQYPNLIESGSSWLSRRGTPRAGQVRMETLALIKCSQQKSTRRLEASYSGRELGELEEELIGLVACRHGPSFSFLAQLGCWRNRLRALEAQLVCRCKCFSFVPLPSAKWPTPWAWPMTSQAGGSLTNERRVATSCACAATITPRKLAEGSDEFTDVYKICQSTIQMEFLIRHFCGLAFTEACGHILAQPQSNWKPVQAGHS